MNALLVYPEFPETFWSFKYALKFIRKKAALPPLGLLTVAAMLPPHWDKRLVDINVRPLTDEDLEWADCAFVSAMNIQRETARRLIARCKKRGVRVVAGGPLFTSEHQLFEEVDHFVLNEAEVTLPPFLTDLAKGRPKRIYTTSEYADIGKTPVPLWELAEMKRYASVNIQFSRGCPFHCDFCNVTALFGHRPRTKTASQVIAELDTIYKLGWRGNIFFVDDNFIGNKHYLKTTLLPALIKRRKTRKKTAFYTEASINLADDEQLTRMMVEAGFDTVFVGIETPDETSLSECGKNHNKHRNLVEDVKRLQRAGLQVQGGFIVGFDNDTPSIFQRQIDFIQQSGIVTAMVGLLQAPSGTKLYERLQGEGRLLGLSSCNNVDSITNFIPKMDFDTLREGYKSILENIYSAEHYYQRVKTFLREYKPPKVMTPTDLQYKLAFFRSLYHLGIRGKERAYFWKLLVWTNFHRPRLLPMAVTLAIYGHHFRMICERHVS